MPAFHRPALRRHTWLLAVSVVALVLLTGRPAFADQATPLAGALAAVPTEMAPATSVPLAASRYDPNAAPESSVATGSPQAAAAVPLGLPQRDPTLEALIFDALGDEVDHYAVVVKELAGGTGAVLDPGRVFYAASLFKLSVMHEAFRQRADGRLSFDEELTVTERSAEQDLGTAESLGIVVGEQLPVYRLLDVMIRLSDNVAAILLLDRVGSRNVDQGLRALGLQQTSVTTAELPTTAADVALLLEAIATGLAVSPAASAEMEALLLSQTVRDRIPAGVPDGVLVGNKTGNWENATHDAAIVYAHSGTYVLVVLSDLPDNGEPIAELSRRIYQYYAGLSAQRGPSSVSAMCPV